jgi:hypothetical protein
LRQFQRLLVIAIAEPEKRASIVAEVEVLTGMRVEFVRANAKQIRETIRICYGADD